MVKSVSTEFANVTSLGVATSTLDYEVKFKVILKNWALSSRRKYKRNLNYQEKTEQLEDV